MIRLHVPDPLDEGAGVALAEGQAHYLRDVMRRGVGDEVLLFNGRDGEWLGRIEAIDRRGARLALRAMTRAQAIGPDLDLIVAVVKRPRLETIVEKAAELGARRVRLALTRFTQAPPAKVERLAAIAAEAAEQTGRLDVPQVLAPEKLDAILDDWAAERTLVFCDEAGDAKPIQVALAAAAPGPYALLIGPEGGFAPEERARLRALSGVMPVSLGPRILRADTAAIAALSLWQSALGDWTP